jgi:hypothetical protein
MPAGGISDKDVTQAATVIDRWINKASRKEYGALVVLAAKKFGEEKARNVMGVIRPVWDDIRVEYPEMELEASVSFEEAMEPAPQMGELETPPLASGH